MGLAVLLPTTALGATPTAGDFTDWTAVSGSPAVATGTLHGQAVSLSGTHVFAPPVSVVDGHWTFFAGPDFSPSLASTDVIQVGASLLTESYTLSFGAPVTDPELEIGSLGSRLEFPAGTVINRLSGQGGFTVSGSTISGAPNSVLGPDGVNDSSGSVQLIGTFTSISFTATFSGSTEDGVLLQVGAVAPTPPPVTSTRPVARFTVSPNPTCVNVPTTLNASTRTGARLIRYTYTYHETNVFGVPDAAPTVLADSSEPVATVRFPWSYQAGALAPPPRKVLAAWVRAPADVTLTITDSTGVTASTTMRVSFAQSSSSASPAACPPGGPPASPPVPQPTTVPRMDGSHLTFPVVCRSTVGDCIGEVIGSTPSLPLLTNVEKFRNQLQAKQQRIDALNKQIAHQLAQARSLGLTGLDLSRASAMLDRGSSPADLAANLGISPSEAQLLHDEWAASRARADAKDRRDALLRAIRNTLDQLNHLKVTLSRATSRRATILAGAPYRISPGHTTKLIAQLTRGARTVLRRYHRLDLTLTIAAVGPTGRRHLKSRAVTIRTRQR